MNKSRLLLLLLVPIVGAAFYLRSLASWRPKKVFGVPGQVSILTFSNDGKILLVCYAPTPSGPYRGVIVMPATMVMALDVQNGFTPLWQRDYAPLVRNPAPQFFDNDSQILLQGRGVWGSFNNIQVLDARSGKTRQTYKNLWGKTSMSPDGKWLAFHYNTHCYESGKSISDKHIYLNPVGTASGPPTHAEKVIGKNIKWESWEGTFSFSPNGQTLAVGVVTEKGAHLDFYNTKTWKLIRTCIDMNCHSEEAYPTYQTVQWSRDGQTLFTVGNLNQNAALQSWRASDGKRLAFKSLSGFFQTTLTNLSFEGDGHALFYNGDGQVKRSKEPLPYTSFYPLLRLPNEPVDAAAISPDSTYLVAGTSIGNLYYQRVK